LHTVTVPLPCKKAARLAGDFALVPGGGGKLIAFRKKKRGFSRYANNTRAPLKFPLSLQPDPDFHI
jgi:hypothetical protein